MSEDGHRESIDVESGGVSSASESIEVQEPLLKKWRNIARTNTRLHAEARAYYKNLADSSLVSAVVIGSTGGLMNIFLGVVDDTQFDTAVNVGQVVLGVTGLLSAGIMSLSKQLGWETKHQLHEEYAARYGEISRMISTEVTLTRLQDSSFASMAEFIKTVSAEINRVEDHAPPIPGFLVKCRV